MSTSWRAELWRYRELVFFLAWRDVKVRYKQATLGVGWAVLQPLLTMVVFTVLFNRVAGISSDGLPYPVFTFSALVMWLYFSGVMTQAGQSLLSNSHLITKVYFPRIALPVAAGLSGLIELAVGLAMLVALLLYYGVSPGWPVLLAPVFLVALFVLAVGTGLLLAALTVRYRDLKHTIPFLLQLWFFATPVIYPTEMVPPEYRGYLALNPLTGIIDGFRACLFPGHPVDPLATGTSLVTTGVICVAGAIYFRKAERAFADII